MSNICKSLEDLFQNDNIESRVVTPEYPINAKNNSQHFIYRPTKQFITDCLYKRPIGISADCILTDIFV